MTRQFPFVAVLFASTLLAGEVARAQSGEEVDDPKMSRRLGPRIDWKGPPAVAGPPPSARPAETTPLPPPVAPVGPAPAEVVTATPRRPAEAQAETERAPPRLKLAFRRFSFVRLGASGTADGLAAPEPFNSVSLDVYPLSSFVRAGLSTQYGWESGTWTSSGDYFAAETLSLGGQLLGHQVVPFAEAFAGIGYMRRLQFDRTVPTAYWQLGFDVGAEIYLARVGYLSAAIGYLRPVNGFVAVQTFTSAFVDTWSFKLGIGL